MEGLREQGEDGSTRWCEGAGRGGLRKGTSEEGMERHLRGRDRASEGGSEQRREGARKGGSNGARERSKGSKETSREVP